MAQEKMGSIFVYFQCFQHALRLRDHMQQVVSNGFDWRKWTWDETPPNKLTLLYVFFCICILCPVLKPSRSWMCKSASYQKRKQLINHYNFYHNITIYCNYKNTSQFQLHGLEGLEAALKSIQCIQSFEVSKPSSRCSFARRWQMFLWDPVDCTSVFRDRLSVTFRSSFFTKGVQRAVVNTLKRTDLFATLCNVNQFTCTLLSTETCSSIHEHGVWKAWKVGTMTLDTEFVLLDWDKRQTRDSCRPTRNSRE